MSSGFTRIKAWFQRSAGSVEESRDGLEPVATPPPGAASGGKEDQGRETSTNAQMEGSADEPWSGNT